MWQQALRLKLLLEQSQAWVLAERLALLLLQLLLSSMLSRLILHPALPPPLPGHGFLQLLHLDGVAMEVLMLTKLMPRPLPHLSFQLSPVFLVNPLQYTTSPGCSQQLPQLAQFVERLDAP